MTRDEAIARAKAHAHERGWSWRGQVEAWRSRRWLLVGPREWTVISNAGMRGGGSRIVLDAKTGAIVEAGFMPY